jgi:hypothetical protein
MNGLKPITILLLVAASFVPVLAALRIETPVDDAYITMTYARSLAQGYGFRIHPTAEPSLGTTTPFYAIALAGISRVLPCVEMVDLALGLSVITWIATGWLWALRGHVFGLNPLERSCIALLVLIETTLWTFYLGMEVHLFRFLLTLCLILWFQQKHTRAGFVAGVLFLTRGEGILILGVFIACQIFRHRNSLSRKDEVTPFHQMTRMIGGFLIPFCFWAVYASLNIGSFLPNTLKAKSIQTEVGPIGSFWQIIEYLFTAYWSNLGFIVRDQDQAQLSVWLLLAALGLCYALLLRRRVLILALWTAGFMVGYIVINAPGYHWYLLPLMYSVTVFAGLAIASVPTLLERLPKHLIARPQLLGTLATVSLMLLIATNTLAKGIPKDPIVLKIYDDYKRLADWINANTATDSKVGFVEVGFLSWYADREIVDLMGLTRPELLSELTRGDFAQVFQKAKPDYLIYIAPFGWALDPVLKSDYFARNFHHAAIIPSIRFRQVPYIIYKQGQVVIPDTTCGDHLFDFTSPETVYRRLSHPRLAKDGSLSMHAGLDPFIYQLGLDLCAADYTHIMVTMSASKGISDRILEVYYTLNNDKDFKQSQCIKIPILPDEGMHTYAIDTSSLPNWNGSIYGLRIDPVMNGSSDGDSDVVIQSFRLVRVNGMSRCAD